MADDYYIDLENIDLESFKVSIENKDLLPGRVVLRENLDQRFGILADRGIKTLGLESWPIGASRLSVTFGRH
jgi:hypothetical protein